MNFENIDYTKVETGEIVIWNEYSVYNNRPLMRPPVYGVN